MSGEQMKSIANIFEQLLAKVLSAEQPHDQVRSTFDRGWPRECSDREAVE
jgi:hypothetical protein